MAEQTIGTISGVLGVGWETDGTQQVPGKISGVIGREQYEPGAGPYLIETFYLLSGEAHGSATLDVDITSMLTGEVAGFNELTPFEMRPLITHEARGGGYLVREFRSLFSVFAKSTGATDGILDGAIPIPAPTAYFGPTADLQVPVPFITASGTVPGFGGLDLHFGFGVTPIGGSPFPVFSLEASGFGGNVGRLDQPIQHRISMSGATGGVTAFAPFNNITVAASGVVEGVGRLAASFFNFSVESTATSGIVARLDGAVPVPVSTGAGSLQAMAVPLPRIVASGEPDGLAASLAYAVNLKQQAMTKYEHWPFRHMVRFQGQYVGVNSAGAFTVGGPDAAGQVFNFEFTVPKIDFGVTSLKRLVHIHLTQRILARMKLSTNPDEHGDILYYVDADVTEPGIHTRRAKLAKGPRARYWTIKVEGLEGDPFDLDDIELRAQIIHGRRLT